MGMHPIVRYMILCNDWGLDPKNPLRINIYGLLTNIHSIDEPPFPLYQELCVFLALTEGRKTGTAQIICIFEDTGEKVFESPRMQFTFGSDPLAVTGIPIRLSECPFPVPGLYSVQFWYNDEKVEERSLKVR